MKIKLSMKDIDLSVLGKGNVPIAGIKCESYEFSLDVANAIKEGGNLGVLVAQAKKAFEESLNPTEAPEPLNFPEASGRGTDATGV